MVRLEANTICDAQNEQIHRDSSVTSNESAAAGSASSGGNAAVQDLVSTGDDAGNYRDQHGRTVYRQSGLGSAGLIFRFPDESVYVYWDASALNPADDADNWTDPYTTADYDATTRLRCGIQGSGDIGSCPAGILRMEDRQASIVITSPAGVQFTLNFMKDYVNASSGEVDAHLEDDTWIVIVSGKERYEVPLAAIQGG